MNLIIPILIVILGGILGYCLDSQQRINLPVLYWLIGAYTALFAIYFAYK